MKRGSCRWLWSIPLAGIFAIAGSVPAYSQDTCPGGSLPVGYYGQWVSLNIGSASDGCAAEASGVFTVKGEGSAFQSRVPGLITGDTTDSFRFVYQQVPGDFQITAMVNLVDDDAPPNPELQGWAGLMVRESLTATSRHVTALRMEDDSPDHRAAIRWRSWNSGTPPNNPEYLRGWDSGIEAPGIQPAYLKIVRWKDQISCYLSDNGLTWYWTAGATLTSLNSPVFVGLVVSQNSFDKRATGTFRNVDLRPLTLPFATSWFANTFPGGYPGGITHVQQNMEAMYVDGAGKIYANSVWDESTAEAVIYNTNPVLSNGVMTRGTTERVLEALHGQPLGGYAVATNGQYVYISVSQGPVADPIPDECEDSSPGGPFCCADTAWCFPPSGTTWQAVRRYNMDGTAAPFTGGKGYDGSMLIVNTSQPVRGLAAKAGHSRLYVSDPAVNKVRVVDLTNMTFLTNTMTVTRPGQLALEANNDLWAVQRDDPSTLNVYTEARVWKFNTSTFQLRPQSITDVQDPQGIAIDPSGKVWVADAGPERRVKGFSSSNGHLVKVLGDTGGILSGTKGETAPTKFNYPRGIGFNSAGEKFVMSDGANGTGTEIRMFGSSDANTPLGEMNALEFIDSADADPDTDGMDLFSRTHHYVMDYSKPAGQGWTYKGMTLDPANTADIRLDPEEDANSHGTLIRRINGKRIMYLTGAFGDKLSVFRFREPGEPASEIAKPCAILSRTNGIPGSGVAPYSKYFWNDTGTTGNNGVIDPGEFSDASNAVMPDWIWFPDENGDVWVTGSNPLRIGKYPVVMNANGCPTYNPASYVGSTVPAGPPGDPITGLMRAYYLPASNAMYLGVFTSQYPEPPHTPEPGGFGEIGTVILRYNNWGGSGSGATFAYQIPGLPEEPNRQRFHLAKSMDVTASAVVVGIMNTGEMKVYDAPTGACVAVRYAGPEVAGKTGLLDTNQALNVYTRANGETLIFAEEGAQAKGLLYRVPSPDATPTLHVTYPNGGESVAATSQVTLKWNACGSTSGNVDILLSRTGMNGSYSTLFADIPNTGSKSWTVTGPAGSDAFIKVVAHSDPNNGDTSNSAFTILSCGPCVVSYCSGVEMRCTWNGTCGVNGCCQYSCMEDQTCAGPDPCPPGACCQ